MIFHRNQSGAIVLAVLATLAIVAAHAASAKGGKAPATATILFDDVAGDEIQSDGLGAYTGSLNSRDGSFKMSSGDDEIYFDFSNAIYPGAVTPFGAAGNSGYLSGVDMSVSYLNGLAGTTNYVLVRFDFIAPAPDGSGPTEWYLQMGMDAEQQDTTGDGQVDTIVLRKLEADPFPFYADLAWRTEPVQAPATGPRRGPPYKDDGWRAAGTFDMTWGARIQR